MSLCRMFPEDEEHLRARGAGVFVCTSIWFHLPFWRRVVLARQSPEVWMVCLFVWPSNSLEVRVSVKYVFVIVTGQTENRYRLSRRDVETLSSDNLSTLSTLAKKGLPDYFQAPHKQGWGFNATVWGLPTVFFYLCIGLNGSHCYGIIDNILEFWMGA